MRLHQQTNLYWDLVKVCKDAYQTHIGVDNVATIFTVNGLKVLVT